MATYEKYDGTVSIFSNSYDTPTGYGQQVKYLADRLKRSGMDVAVLSNYGLEGTRSTIKTPYGKIAHFPRGMDPYCNDTAPFDHKAFASRYEGQKDLLISLYDVWVMTAAAYDTVPNIASWVPLDHVTMPPAVKRWLEKPNVTPLAMSPFGMRQLEENGIKGHYIPHGIETKVYKPTYDLPTGQNVYEYMKTEDKFVVGMVAANKSSGMVHRKAYSENILAFSIFQKRHPNAILYLHTEPLSRIGWNLVELGKACGIPADSMAFPDPLEYRYGIEKEGLAALYTGMDVMLAPSYGEGFGVPTIEAQACGTPVIGSDWAATSDLVSDDGWLVDGQPPWDSAQLAWWRIPNVPSIVEALEAAYQRGRGRSQASIDFAKQFDVETVWQNNWQPYLKSVFG